MSPTLVADVDPTLDPDVVAPVLRAVEALLLAHPEITEIDVNPVRLTPTGAVALDALDRVRRKVRSSDGNSKARSTG